MGAVPQGDKGLQEGRGSAPDTQVPNLERERKNQGQAGCCIYLASQLETEGASEKPRFLKSQGCCYRPPTLSS